MKGLMISGAGGFLGGNLLAQVPADMPVLALSSRVEKLDRFAGKAQWTVLDNEEFFAGDFDLSGYSLIHLAYVRSHEFPVVKESLDFTGKLLRKSQALGVQRVVHISSQSVYGVMRERPARVTDPVVPTNLYDIGKYYLENWIRDFAEFNRMDYLNLRIGSLVGNGFAERITSRLIQNALTQGLISVQLNGKVFSYTHVSDMARAILMAANLPRPAWNRIYNVGTTEVYTLADIADVIALELKGRGLPLVVEKVRVAQSGENSSLDSLEFRQVTQWQPQLTLGDIIRDEVEYQLHLNEGQHVSKNLQTNP